ncbi:hypothetical protein AGMMS50218_07150 [Actinomycetota bacterium]|nr:hypothetical protein AGMMS50218_07150 [Actinomycetota bacterium]
MDLKFRSDLLGRSVLFLGYSFNDINIRIIWHKLMEMMRDVPDADRPVSWIVKFASDPVQEELNRAAGIRTIVLNHDRRFGEESSPTERLEAFLLDLSILASDASLIPGSMVRRQFISEALLHSIEFATTSASGNLRGQAARTLALRQLIQAMSERALPPRLAERAGDILYLLVGLRLDNQGTIEAVVDAATNIARQGFYPSGVGGVFLRALTREGPRSTLLAHLQAWSESDAPFDWPQVYRGPHPTALLGNLHRTLKFEIDAHDPLSANSFSAPDVDLFYCFDIALRVIRGEVRPADPLPSQMRRDFRSSIKRIKALYPSLEAYDPPRGHGPDIEMARRFQEILPPQPDPLEFDWEQADLTN